MDPSEKATSKYTSHPSILLINDKIVNEEKLSFKPRFKLDSINIVAPSRFFLQQVQKIFLYFSKKHFTQTLG